MDRPLIPRAALYGNPERADVQISPDGSHLSWLAPVDGVLNVWVAPVDDLAAARPVTTDTRRGIRSHDWAYTNRHVLFPQDTGGDEDFHLYSVDIDSGAQIDLTPFPGVSAGLSASAWLHAETSAEAATLVASMVRPGDLVLVKGSRGTRTDLVVDRLRETGA